jgi:hypothetical protein
MSIRRLTISYAGILASFDDPATAAVVQAPEIAARAEKAAKRRIQRNGNREPTSKSLGRPKLTEAQAEESKAKRRAYMRDLMRRKSALAKDLLI